MTSGLAGDASTIACGPDTLRSVTCRITRGPRRAAETQRMGDYLYKRVPSRSDAINTLPDTARRTCLEGATEGFRGYVLPSNGRMAS